MRHVQLMVLDRTSSVLASSKKYSTTINKQFKETNIPSIIMSYSTGSTESDKIYIFIGSYNLQMQSVVFCFCM